MSNAVGARELADMSKLAPAMVAGVATRLYSRLGLANRLSPMFNTVVTNVPGPQVPLHMAGARMVASYGLGPVMDSMGLFHAGDQLLRRNRRHGHGVPQDDARSGVL